MNRLVIFALVMGLISAADAEEPLTWEACVVEASQNNPDLAASRETVAKARSQYRGSYSNFLPQLSANAGYSRANSPTSLESFSAGSGIREEFSMGLSARQSLFAGLRNKAGVEKSEAELRNAEANLKAIKSQLGFDLKGAFARLLFAQEQMDLTRTISSRRKGNVRLVELRYDAGREHKGSYLRSKAIYRQAKFEVSQAKRSLRVARRDLAKVLGRKEFDVIKVTGSFKTSLPGELPDFRALALETPAHVKVAAQTRAAQAGVAIARSQLFPEVSATASASRRGSDWPPGTDRWSAGLSLSFPFFQGGRNIFDVKSAKAEERRTKLDLRSADDKAALNLEESFARFQDATEKTEVQKEFLEAAEVRAEISRSQYTSGLLSFEDWDLIENDLIANQKTLLSSLRDAVIAEANWELAQGKGAIP